MLGGVKQNDAIAMKHDKPIAPAKLVSSSAANVWGSGGRLRWSLSGRRSGSPQP
jgi:hypothetical protein